MQRRRFLTAALSVGLLTPFGKTGWIARGGEPDQRRLIVVFLRGAVDGLNVVVPYGDPHYYELRIAIAVRPPGREHGALDLDGHFGLHPALQPIMPLWQSGQLAFVHASGSPDPTRSHFDAQLFMENGTPGRGAMPDGWMNRLLGILPGGQNASRAIAFGPQIPRILAGSQPVANLGSANDVGKQLPIDRPEVNDAFARLYGGNDALSRSFQQGRQARQQMTMDASVGESGQQEQMVADGGAPLPNGFPMDAARLAQMMRKDPGIRLAFFALGGWDTHIRQGAGEGQLAGRLRPLADGLAALAKGLGPAFNDSLILVMSEFGRTAHENGNGGTDHGHGNVLWALGGEVAGKHVYGRWPGLAGDQLYQQRDLAITTDFRQVIGPTVTRHLRLPDQAIATLFPDLPAGGEFSSLVRS
jgi:uncharacterized protein (DUF1501 family)